MVRSCEGAMILTSLPTLNGSCPAIKASLDAFSVKIAESKFLFIKKAHHKTHRLVLQGCHICVVKYPKTWTLVKSKTVLYRGV